MSESRTTQVPPKRATLAELAAVFGKLGCLSFGGPYAHLGYFRAELVAKRAWLDDTRYGELVALCQFLPGPASSQVVFAIGLRRAGWLGGLVASLAFLLPSTLLMIAAGYGVIGRDGGPTIAPRWLHGLELAAVAVVAHAAWSMALQLARGWAQASIAVAATSALLAWHEPYAQLVVLAGGAVLGWLAVRSSPNPPVTHNIEDRGRAWPALACFAALLFALPLAVALTDQTGSRPSILAEIDACYRAGALVFGGGHVVLPLLHAEVVAPGWISEDTFLAGYGLAQAVPGPMFSFVAYLGTAIDSSLPRWANALVCLFAVYAPAWLLVAGALPLWQKSRSHPGASRFVAGASAAVVGMIFAALYDPIGQRAIGEPSDALLAAGGLAALLGRVPVWLVAGALASAGAAIALN